MSHLELKHSTSHHPQTERQLVVIASTMRSGSTLLKALLGTAPDISNLSEVNFQRFSRVGSNLQRLWRLSDHRILVLKRPAWFHEVSIYPRLPDVSGLKTIFLVRDAYSTVLSLKRMLFGRFAGSAPEIVDRWLATRYWLPLTRRLWELSQSGAPDDTTLVKYETLLDDPVGVTGELFSFIGSSQLDGVDSYREPDDHRRWRWGRDDNSPRIRSLKVQPPRHRLVVEDYLSNMIAAQPSIANLRKAMGYPFHA